MSFVPNYAQQISLFDKLAFLSKRKQQMLEKSWAQAFSDHVFTRINEHIFAPLYSEKTNSRPKGSRKRASLISAISMLFIRPALKISLSASGL